MASYSVTVVSAVGLQLQQPVRAVTSLLSTARFHLKPIAKYAPVPLVSAVGVHPVLSYAWHAGGLLIGGLGLHDVTTAAAKFGLTRTEKMTLHATITVGRPVALVSAVGLHDSRVIALVVHMSSGVGVQLVVTTKTTYGVVQTHKIALHDSLARYLTAIMTSAVGVHPVVLQTLQRVASIVSVVGVQPVMSPRLLFQITATSGVDFTDAELLRMIYAGDPLLDGFLISAAYVEPSGGFTTWAVNTRTSAVTEYSNYVFNSFAQMGIQTIGATSKGLYVLSGARDGTANISARMQSGILAIGGAKFTSFKAAYLGMRIDDDGTDVFLKLTAGDGRTYTYAVKPQDMMTTKINFGKGLRSRYFSFELTTSGADFDLDGITFVPIVTQRRV